MFLPDLVTPPVSMLRDGASMSTAGVLTFLSDPTTQPVSPSSPDDRSSSTVGDPATRPDSRALSMAGALSLPDRMTRSSTLL